MTGDRRTSRMTGRWPRRRCWTVEDLCPNETTWQRIGRGACCIWAAGITWCCSWRRSDQWRTTESHRNNRTARNWSIGLKWTNSIRRVSCAMPMCLFACVFVYILMSMSCFCLFGWLAVVFNFNFNSVCVCVCVCVVCLVGWLVGWSPPLDK